MRLPTVTAKQALQETARAAHEAIWTAHQAGESYVWPGEPEPVKSRKAFRVHSNLHSFWISRGFRLSVKLRTDRRIVVTLTPAPVKARPSGWHPEWTKGQAA